MSAVTTYTAVYELTGPSPYTNIGYSNGNSWPSSVSIVAGQTYNILLYSITVNNQTTTDPSIFPVIGATFGGTPVTFNNTTNPNNTPYKLGWCASFVAPASGQTAPQLIMSPQSASIAFNPGSSPPLTSSVASTLPEFYSDIYIGNPPVYSSTTLNQVATQVYTGSLYSIQAYPQAASFTDYTIAYNPVGSSSITSGFVQNVNVNGTAPLTPPISVLVTVQGTGSYAGQQKTFNFNMLTAPLTATVTYGYGSQSPQTVSGASNASFTYDSTVTAAITVTNVSATAATSPLPILNTDYTISTTSITNPLSTTSVPVTAAHTIINTNFAWPNFPGFIITAASVTVSQWTLNTIESGVSTPTPNWQGSTVVYSNTKTYTISTTSTYVTPADAATYADHPPLTSSVFSGAGSYTFNLAASTNYQASNSSPTLIIVNQGSIPSLQEVTTAGNTTDQGITILDQTNISNTLTIEYLEAGQVSLLVNNNNTIKIGAGSPGPTWTFSSSGWSGNILTVLENLNCSVFNYGIPRTNVPGYVTIYGTNFNCIPIPNNTSSFKIKIYGTVIYPGNIAMVLINDGLPLIPLNGAHYYRYSYNFAAQDYAAPNISITNSTGDNNGNGIFIQIGGTSYRTQTIEITFDCYDNNFWTFNTNALQAVNSSTTNVQVLTSGQIEVNNLTPGALQLGFFTSTDNEVFPNVSGYPYNTYTIDQYY
jgi:hypothetical protein